MVHFCCAYGCYEKFKKGSGLGFFRFPLQKSRRIQWTLAVRRKDFVPTSHTRICGKHFITGRPSKDINHPDYVPSIFWDSSGIIRNANHKKKFGGKKLCEREELPALSTNGEINPFLDVSVGSDNDNFFSVDKDDQDSHPGFQLQYENSPLINAETIKKILELDTVNDPSNNRSTDSSSNRQQFNPRLFTFVDVTGRTIARFAEKRVRRDELYSKQPSKYPTETVQIIIDKKQAKTIAVDRRAICISKDPSLCCRNNERKACIIDLSADVLHSFEAKTEPNSVLDTESIKEEPESDLESKENERDFINFFSELRDEQQNNCLEIKIQDICGNFSII